ncbi:MAG: hypothetical protein IKZ06_00235, partial [Oscillospiraceae bacterium]|nr:hypothetical protein [Oscillospiraceae bacterium]
MKKICSVFFALFLFFAVGITSFAAEEPLRLFSVAPEKETSAEEVFSYAAEKSFGGILLDMRGNDSKNFYKDLKNLCTEDFLLYVFSDESDAKKYSDSAKIVIDSGFSEETVSSIFEKTVADNLCFYLSFEDSKS